MPQPNRFNRNSPSPLSLSVSMLFVAANLFAATLVAEPLVLAGGTVHTLVGGSFVGDVVIADGMIVAVGADIATPHDATRIDVSGHHVYPGLCDALSAMGLIEVNAISATVDTTEIGAYNPHLQATTAIHPASEVIPVSRANGITHVLSAPGSGRDGIISGQAALIHLAGWTVEEMAIDSSIAMMMQWPEVRTRSFDFATFSFVTTPYGEAKEKAEDTRNELRDWLDAARHYAQAKDGKRREPNLQLEALARVLDGGQKVILMADQAADIEDAVAFAEEQGLDMILGGGRDAWKVKELLAEKSIPVILGLALSLPQQEDDPYDLTFRNAGELHAAGVTIAFASSAGGGGGPSGPHNSRLIPYESANTAAYGLPREEALKALTINPARMFGVGDKLGTIEAGKIANLIVTDGDPLEITTHFVHVIIDGKVTSTENRHRSLYERYRSRP